MRCCLQSLINKPYAFLQIILPDVSKIKHIHVDSIEREQPDHVVKDTPISDYDDIIVAHCYPLSEEYCEIKKSLIVTHNVRLTTEERTCSQSFPPEWHLIHGPHITGSTWVEY